MMAPPSTPDAFPTSDMFDTLIKVEVGAGSQMRTFQIFKGVLCFYSGYFNASLNGRFVEGQRGHVKLPTEDPKLFELFRMWIHTRRFYESTMAPSQVLPFRMLAQLWVFADAHDVPLLQNIAADLVIEKIKASKAFLEMHDLTYIADNTVGSSTLRLLTTEVFHVLSGYELDFDDSGSTDNEEQQSSFAALQRPLDYRKLDLSKLRCKYHVHADGAHCKQP